MTEFSKGIPDKPTGLSSDESRLWDELIDQLPAAVLKRRDPRLLRELCSTLAMRDRLSPIVREDIMGPASDLHHFIVEMQMVFSKVFGMSPVDRANMTDIPPDEPDDFEDWMNG